MVNEESLRDYTTSEEEELNESDWENECWQEWDSSEDEELDEGE